MTREDGIVFMIVKEGEGGPLEPLSDDSVHTIIRYCPETGSLSKAVKRDEPAIVRNLLDPIDYVERPALSKIWDCMFMYDGISKFEMTVEYFPNSKSEI